MTKEYKDLLLKDLCARLPYGVKCEVNTHTERLDSIDPFEEIATFGFQSFDVSEVKPYLRPMSSMTEEEKSQYNFYLTRIEYAYDASLLIDWLNANHFDYRGLISKGLAIEAPEGMYGKEG